VNLVGLSAGYHDAACCLLVDGVLVAAVEEERFTRIKHDARLPMAAFRFCLAAAGLDITDLDAIAYYESPSRKRERQLRSGVAADDPRIDASLPERAIRELLGWEGPIHWAPHHEAHAASAFFASGFDDAAILVADAVGEWATTSYGSGRGATLETLGQVDFPHSLGLYYSTLTAWLGFAVNHGEYKVMGLAPYGEPRYLERMRALIESRADGEFRLNLDYFDFIGGTRMYSERLSQLLGAPPRLPGAPLTQLHMDVARSAQLLLEEILLEKARWLHARSGLADLCLAGGVALNVVANGRIAREGPFARVFVPPAPGDSGACIGAAALAHVALTGERPRISVDGRALRSAALGPRCGADEVARLLATTGLPLIDYRQREDELLQAVVDRLVDGQVIGWFHGALEFGPRALGGRSLLADPRNPDMRDRLNRLVKQREAFRPFAPSVLEAHATAHFDLAAPAPFMAQTCAVRSPLSLPAITHVDGSARPQTVNAADLPRFAALLDAFHRRTGCPLLVNTSFNVAGEPIVATPADALSTFAVAAIDALVLEDCLLDRRDLPPDWAQRVTAWRPVDAVADAVGLRETLYSFV
jgi:carbamoyltransferase